MVRVGIVGYRNFTNKAIFDQVINEFSEEHGQITTVISGGANGADTLAEEYARGNNIHLIVHYANWENGRSAGPLRNTKIVADSDYLIAFLSDKSKGTLDTIRKAEKKGILVKIVKI